MICPSLSTARYKYLHVFPTQDVGLIHPIRRAAHLQMLMYALIDLRRVTLYPTEHGRVIYVETSLTYHLFDISIRELEAAVPSDTQKNERQLEVSPFERGFSLLQEYDSRWVIDEPEENSCSIAILATEPARVTLRLPEPLPVLNREDKSLDHLGLDEVAVELIELIQPEVVAREV